MTGEGNASWNRKTLRADMTGEERLLLGGFGVSEISISEIRGSGSRISDFRIPDFKITEVTLTLSYRSGMLLHLISFPHI